MEPISLFEAHSNYVIGLVFSADNKILISSALTAFHCHLTGDCLLQVQPIKL